MKFKKGKLYRVVKRHKGCEGCILKYDPRKDKNRRGKIIKISSTKCEGQKRCAQFDDIIHSPGEYKVVEHVDMVKFCKKLRKELRDG